MKLNLERYHWRHYFGGVAVILLILQLLTGIFLSMFYLPDLQNAYASVQSLYKDFTFGALMRDGHRWLAFFIFVAIIVHAVRSLLRKDFLNYPRRSSWLTGGLLFLPILAMLVTGLILPWEWKAYWFMEMVPNYLGGIPFVGPALKTFLIDAFSLSRNLIAHAVILPVIAYILIDFHILAMFRRRKSGISKYLAKHAVISIPLLLVVIVLAIYIPMPTEDPDITPMPLEGTNIPTPEWFFLFLLRPFQNFSDTIAPILGIFLPAALLVGLAALPYAFKSKHKMRQVAETSGMPYIGDMSRPLGKLKKNKLTGAAASFLIVVLMVSAPFGVLYTETYESPTLGCNSCHNVMMGARMGIPPEAFKDRKVIPLVDDNHWMIEHWFYPQVAW